MSSGEPSCTPPFPVAQPGAVGCWRCRDRELTWGERTLVMGVVNVTPDSFFDGGHHAGTDAAVEHGQALWAAGADILDIGGESSRPGAEPVAAKEECRRVLPVIARLATTTQAVLSVDTCKAKVARAALAAGAHVVNDITAGQADGAMIPLLRKYDAGFILMHMQGEPRTMQADPHYADVVEEVYQFLAARAQAVIAAGVAVANLAVDPGIGFGKTFDHNWTLLAHLPRFAALGVPLLVGASRKRFLGALCGRPVEERLAASLAVAALAAERGAAIIRTHDVKETCDAVRVADRLRSATSHTTERSTCGD